MNSTAAILFRKDGYDTTGQRLLGRQAAGEGFLRAIMQHGASPDVYCYAPTREVFDTFCNLVRPWARGERRVHWLPERSPAGLSVAGTLYRPDGMLSELLWQRRHYDPRSYSICGVTHTIASYSPQKAIGDLLIAPSEPWDALICTSQAVRTAALRILETFGEYLAERIGAKPKIVPKLPVIPLGIDIDKIAHGEEARAARARLRGQFNVGDGDIVLLYVGRLIFYAKAHPAPMYIAAERAARRTKRRLVLLHAGWFETEKEEADFKAAASEVCPSVTSIFVDGRSRDIQRDIWSAGDIFVSLSDNIQESFGLTPIEAMSAGLPVVVSAWDGYRESVRDGVDGFCIPTAFAPPGSGSELASHYGVENMSYTDYVATVAMATAVDVAAFEDAIVRLAEDSNLRRRLGESGRSRACAVYSWKVVLQAYEGLWAELADIRAASSPRTETRGVAPPNPLLEDPFGLFAHYATRTLSREDRLTLGPTASPENFSRVQAHGMLRYGREHRASGEVLRDVLNGLAKDGSHTVGEILDAHSTGDDFLLLRTLAYLLKFDFVRLR